VEGVAIHRAVVEAGQVHGREEIFCEDAVVAGFERDDLGTERRIGERDHAGEGFFEAKHAARNGVPYGPWRGQG
jgi:hypothetical protein